MLGGLTAVEPDACATSHACHAGHHEPSVAGADASQSSGAADFSPVWRVCNWNLRCELAGGLTMPAL